MNLVLDFVFVAWIAYFMLTGNLVPPGLLSQAPTTQATHIEDIAPPVHLPLDDDQTNLGILRLIG
jgi:hypothetical protein